MSQPLVTVIIPSYNHSDYVGYTIKSVLAQTLQDFELLIIDDNSPDNSVEVIKKFDDSRIKLITLEKNLGICKTSNFCFKKANGKYLSIIASDDIMFPKNLEKKVNFLEQNPQYGAVFSGVEVIDENNQILFKKTKKFERVFTTETKKRSDWLNHFFYKGNCIAAPTSVARTDCIKKIHGFNELISQAHDFDMWIKICLSGYEMFVLPEKLIQYRQKNNNRSLSSNTTEVRKRLIFDNEKILENYLSIKNIEELIQIFPNLAIYREKISEELIPFFIAQEALKVSDYSHHQFALSTLYNLLKSEDAQKKLEKDFDFTIKDFVELVTNNPLGVVMEEINQKPLQKFLSKKIAELLNFRTIVHPSLQTTTPKNT
jgi:glycosyltransferase involved in cell wall biosynthesis